MTDHEASNGLPSDTAILEFIDGCETPPSVKEVARAFSLPQDAARAPLRRRLKTLASQGRIAKQRGRRVAAPDQLPEVTVLIVRTVDRDGSLLAVPAIETDRTDNPQSAFCPTNAAAARRGPASSVLARLRKITVHAMKAVIIRILDSAPRRLFGVATPGRGGLVLQQAERGGRDTIMLEKNGDIPSNEGDLVEAELLPRRGYIGKTARIIDNLGTRRCPGGLQRPGTCRVRYPACLSR